jgi:hypothetical protein
MRTTRRGNPEGAKIPGSLHASGLPRRPEEGRLAMTMLRAFKQTAHCCFFLQKKAGLPC